MAKGKILLVDSNQWVADMYKERLLAFGFECDVVASGREVFEKILHTNFDFILLEFVLAEEKGIDVLRELRTNPVYDRELKVIMLSDVTDRNLRQEAVSLGSNGLLIKSDYPPHKISEELQRYLYHFEEKKKNEERFRNGGVPIPKNKKVLLVENEDVFVDIFGKRLRDEGYEVDIAINGIEGFEKAVATRYNIIITDMMMPGLNGKELIDQLATDERTKDTPVFLFSASVNDSVLESFRREGIRCFLKTHLTPSELVREVNAFLDAL